MMQFFVSQISHKDSDVLLVGASLLMRLVTDSLLA